MANAKEGKAGGSSDAEGALAQMESKAMEIASAIPIGFLKDWVKGYFNPEETVKMQEGKGLSDVAVYFAFVGFLTWLVFAPSMMLNTVTSRGQDFGIAMMSIGAMLFLYPIFAIIGGFFISAIYYLVARVLGGKGGFGAQTCCLAIISGGTVLLSLPFNLLGIIPCLGFVFSLAALAISLYGLYSQYRAIKSLHQLSPLKAAAVIIVPILIVLAVAVLLVAFAIAGLAAGLAGVAAAGAMG